MYSLKLHHRSLCVIIAALILVSGSHLIQADTGTCGGVSTTLPFTDVSSGNIFFCAIAEAYFSGLTNGTSATTFSPSDSVPREQMAAFVTRTQDSAIRRGSRRAVGGEWATPQNDSLLKKTVVGSSPRFPCFDGEDIWVPSFSSGNVTRVHASDGRVLGTWTGAAFSTSSVAAAGFIYVAGNALSTGEAGKIYRIDPALAPGAVTVVESNLGNQPKSITFDGLNLWTANQGTGPDLGSISRFNIDTTIATNFGVGFNQPIGIIFDGTNLWVVDKGDDALYRVNPANGTVIETVDLGTVGQDSIPAFDGSNIWVPVTSGVKVVNISTPARVFASLTSNGLSGGDNFAVAFDGERMLVSHYPGGTTSSVSMWRAASLTPLGSLAISDGIGSGVVSDGLHFWISVKPSAGNNFLERY